VYAVVLPAETSQEELDLFATVLQAFIQVEGQVGEVVVELCYGDVTIVSQWNQVYCTGGTLPTQVEG
jgi:hypothetical protein